MGFFFKIYLFSLTAELQTEKTEISHPLARSPCEQTWAAPRPGAQIFFHISHMDAGTSTQVIVLLYQASSRQSDWKLNIQDANWCPYRMPVLQMAALLATPQHQHQEMHKE